MPAEPWLSGSLAGVHIMIAPTLFSYQQAREDLAHWTEGLTGEQIWAAPHGLAPVGFQLRHIAGSVERLTTYLRGEQLTPDQVAAMKTEQEPGEGREALLRRVDHALRKSEDAIRSLDPALVDEPRVVGRSMLPTTVIGLLVHLAEHTQRHVGEAIITSKLARQL